MYSNIEKKKCPPTFAKYPYYTHLLSSNFHTKVANATLVLSHASVTYDVQEYCGDFQLYLAKSDSETVCDCRPHRKLDQQTVFLLRVASPTSENDFDQFKLFSLHYT